MTLSVRPPPALMESLAAERPPSLPRTFFMPLPGVANGKCAWVSFRYQKMHAFKPFRVVH